MEGGSGEIVEGRKGGEEGTERRAGEQENQEKRGREERSISASVLGLEQEA